MSKNLYLLHFNNYFDRKIKKYSTLSEYQNNTKYKVFYNINFIYGNGVETTQIFNIKNNEEEDAQFYNYCLVVDKNDNIESRWFVLEQIRNSHGQYTISLKRDCVSDFWDDIKKSKFYCSKSSYDPFNYYTNKKIGTAIFNEEPLNLNLQPSRQYNIINNYGFNWLTAFIPKTGTGATGTITAYSYDPQRTADKIFTTDEMSIINSAGSGYSYKQVGECLIGRQSTNTQLQSYYIVDFTYDGDYSVPSSAYTTTYTNEDIPQLQYGFLKYNQTADSSPYIAAGASDGINYGAQAYTVAEAMYNNPKSFASLIFKDITYERSEYNQMESIYNNYNNKIVKKPNGDTFYKLKITKNISNYSYTVTESQAQNFHTLIRQTNSVMTTGLCTNWVTQITRAKYTVTFENISLKADAITIASNRQHTIDCPYDIITFPYNPAGKDFTFNNTYAINNQNQLSFINNISTANSTQSDYVSTYDVIITPFCPIDNIDFPSDGSIISTGQANIDYKISNNETGLLFYCSRNYINCTWKYNFMLYSGKIGYLTRKYELVSPDHKTKIPLNIYQNTYNLNTYNTINFNIKQTLLPYSSKIQIKPEYDNYNGIYNTDNNDLGLIFDITRLTQMSSSWIEYVNNNSNYNNLFNLQVQYAQEQNTISNQQTYNNINLSKKNAILNASTGLLNTVTNAAAGNYGKALSAGTGVITGAISSAWSIENAYANQTLTEKAQNASIQYTKDNYNLQMENIQNRSSIISTVGGLFNGYNYYPYILTYESTGLNSSLYNDYFSMNGYTYNVPLDIPVSDIDNNYSTYIEGYIYRFNENINADAELCTAINNELKAGVYI